MNLFRINRSWLVKKTATITSGIYAGLSMLVFWVDLTEVFSRFSIIHRILISTGIFVAIAIVCFISCLLYLKFRKRFCVFTADNGHKISIQFGDILNYSQDSKHNNLCSVVIPVNRCFDTIVDDNLIAKSSLHGQFIKWFMETNCSSGDLINQLIKSQLSDRPHVDLSTKEKSVGNLKRYPIGTVVKLDMRNKHFFLVGLSSFDVNLKASTTKEEYVIAIQKLIEFCDANAQGAEVCMPLIGTALSRVGVSKNDAMQYLLYAVVLNKEHLNFDLTIIIPENERNSITLTKLY